MSLKENYKQALLDGLEQLIKEGSNKDYWRSTRSISDAIIALEMCLPPDEFQKLRFGALKYLIAQSEICSDDSLNWMEEVWDTSVALIAIASEPVLYSREIAMGRKWIFSKFLLSHNSWNDEVWETLLALNAVSYLNKKIPTNSDCTRRFSTAIDWLMQMLNTPKKGLLINWSSTALFVLLSASPNFPELDPEQIDEIKMCSAICADTILEADIMQYEDLLWTAEVWSNALVLWALSVSKRNLMPEEKAFKIVKWFKARISAPDLPTEDRAFACIALYKYLEYVYRHEVQKSGKEIHAEGNATSFYVEEALDKIQAKIAIGLKKRVKDFQLKPPLITSDIYQGFYSIHIHSKLLNVVLIILGTTMLSYLTWLAQMNKGYTWLVFIPITIGTLATMAQLANFTLWPYKKSHGNLNTTQTEE